MLFAIHSDVSEAGFLVFGHVGDGDILTVLFVQGGVILAILVIAQGHDLEFRRFHDVRGINAFGASKADSRQHHNQRHEQSYQFLHLVFLLF